MIEGPPSIAAPPSHERHGSEIEAELDGDRLERRAVQPPLGVRRGQQHADAMAGRKLPVVAVEVEADLAAARQQVGAAADERRLPPESTS